MKACKILPSYCECCPSCMPWKYRRMGRYWMIRMHKPWLEGCRRPAGRVTNINAAKTQPKSEWKQNKKQCSKAQWGFKVNPDISVLKPTQWQRGDPHTLMSKFSFENKNACTNAERVINEKPNLCIRIQQQQGTSVKPWSERESL